MKKTLLVLTVLSLAGACEPDDAPPVTSAPPVIEHDADPAIEALCLNMAADVGDLCGSCPALSAQLGGKCEFEAINAYAHCSRVDGVDQARLATCNAWLSQPGCMQTWSDDAALDCFYAWSHTYDR